MGSNLTTTQSHHQAHPYTQAGPFSVAKLPHILMLVSCIEDIFFLFKGHIRWLHLDFVIAQTQEGPHFNSKEMHQVHFVDMTRSLS